MSSPAQEVSAQFDQDLCEVCRKVNFDELFNSPARECHDECFAQTLPNSAYNYGTLEELQNRSFYCYVCSFLVNGWIANVRRPSEVQPKDILVLKRWRKETEAPTSWLNLYGVKLDGPTASCAQFGPSGNEYYGIVVTFQPSTVSKYGSMNHFRAFTQEELNDQAVNFDLVRSWMGMCEEHHVTSCWQTSHEQLKEADLRLIDVNSREIINTRMEVRYVALSYACSQAGEVPAGSQPFDQHRLPEQIPQTISDAITVVKALGEQYLWVDAYCINQHDVAEKQRLISKMDLVYERATVTICVANSSNTGPGIHGISVPIPRKDQVVQITPIGTFMTIEVPRLLRGISQAVWSRRGWTLQEAVISRRCLLFTQMGVALWCRSQVFHEAFDYIVPRFSSGMRPIRPRGYGIGIDRLPFTIEIESQWDFETWNQLMHVYSLRALTRDDDGLNAIAGIFNRYCRSSGESIACGIPLSVGVGSLLWRVNHYGYCQRRQPFPSWSWIGWKDTHGVSYDYWVDSSRGETLPSQRRLELPKIGLSVWGRPGLGPIWVDLQYEAQIITDYSDPDTVFDLRELTLKTRRAFFRIRHSPEQSQPDYGGTNQDKNQVWELLDSDMQKVPVIKGRSITMREKDMNLILPKELNFPEGNMPKVEFLCVQYWTEEGGPYAVRNFGNVVTAIAVIRNLESGKAKRIGTIAIPHEHWRKVEDPNEIIVTLA